MIDRRRHRHHRRCVGHGMLVRRCGMFVVMFGAAMMRRVRRHGRRVRRLGRRVRRLGRRVRRLGRRVRLRRRVRLVRRCVVLLRPVVFFRRVVSLRRRRRIMCSLSLSVPSFHFRNIGMVLGLASPHVRPLSQRGVRRLSPAFSTARGPCTCRQRCASVVTIFFAPEEGPRPHAFLAATAARHEHVSGSETRPNEQGNAGVGFRVRHHVA